MIHITTEDANSVRNFREHAITCHFSIHQSGKLKHLSIYVKI